METIDASWLVATEVCLDAEGDEEEGRPSIYAQLVVTAHAEAHGEGQEYKISEKLLLTYLEELYIDAGYYNGPQLAMNTLATIQQLPVPVFGSAPKDFQTLQGLIAASLPLNQRRRGTRPHPLRVVVTANR
ncbi:MULTISPECIES: hypothetical protein [unclassified Nonomuraea]|uniref:hypothetical protein n=1 Tax=unclassified Nonomuraea TaxID=2593643 RepID=UPI0033C8CDB4